MGSISLAQGLAMIEQSDRRAMKTRNPVAAECATHGEDREIKLAEAIRDHCAKQWPPWLVSSARTDVPSTLPVGYPDMTVWGPGWVALLELKSKTGKPSPAQREWGAKFAALGWTMHVIRTMDEFLAAVEASKKESNV